MNQCHSYEFWIVHIVDAHEETCLTDNDYSYPGSNIKFGQNHPDAVSPALIADEVRAKGADYLAMYAEAIRDYYGANFVAAYKRWLAHEVGHQFGLGHLLGIDQTTAAPNSEEIGTNKNAGFMNTGSLVPGSGPDPYVVPRHLNLLRLRLHSPGKNQ